jgi:long-chain acyl-CoA synthetase
MLYDRWRAVARRHANELALRDTASGAQWTFQQLLAAGERCILPESPFVFPRGRGPEFILAVLAGWRLNRIVCPVDGQIPNILPPELPARVHLKQTSATTGAPRWVAFTAPQLAADARNIVETMELRPERPNLGVISMAHSYGFSNLVLPLLLHGIPLHLVPDPLPESVRRAASSLSAVTLPSVPALWRAWHEAKAIPPSLQLAISAGAPLPIELEQAIYSSTGVKVHNFYGSTECGGIAYDRSPVPRTNPQLVGAALRRVNLSIKNDGCLLVQSEAVGESYLPTPDPALAQGRFHTSDLAELRGEEVVLLGRASEMINVAGRKVATHEIEQALNVDPAVRDALAFGVPDTHTARGERIVACVVLTPGATLRDVQQRLRAALPDWKNPRDWWVVDSLTPNQRGKISRATWRDQYLARRA